MRYKSALRDAECHATMSLMLTRRRADAVIAADADVAGKRIRQRHDAHAACFMQQPPMRHDTMPTLPTS